MALLLDVVDVRINNYAVAGMGSYANQTSSVHKVLSAPIYRDGCHAVHFSLWSDEADSLRHDDLLENSRYQHHTTTIKLTPGNATHNQEKSSESRRYHEHNTGSSQPRTP